MNRALTVFVLVLLTKLPYAQGQSNPYVKNYTIKVNANATGWTSTGIQIGKGDCVLFQVLGNVDLGSVTKDVFGLGSINPFLLVHNRFNGFNHGSLLTIDNERLIPPVEGQRLFLKMRQARLIMPPSLSEHFNKENFIGNYFIATTSQELKFIINDKKIDDNHGSFDVNVTILPFTPVPNLDGNFDFAKYVDTYNGKVPFCFDDDCLPKHHQSKNSSNGLWFYGSDEKGHFYLTINPVGYYGKDISTAVKILLSNIYFVFPGRAVDQQQKDNPEKSSVQLNHKYDLIYKFANSNTFNEEVFDTHLDIDMTPQVKAIAVSRYHFTFEANGSHLLRGTAIHGLFKDKCGQLYMFQQGRGVPDEWWVQGQANFPAAYYMWQIMAANLSQLIQQKYQD